MSDATSITDPDVARKRRTTRLHTFKPGTVDPIIEKRRPFFTIGNAILFASMIAFGLYATGNLPEVDLFFDHLNIQLRSENNIVVRAIIGSAFAIAFSVAVAFSGWFVFLYVNSRRRRLSDPKGWHKTEAGKR